MANYIQQLQKENEELKAKLGLENKKEVLPENDDRNEIVEIVYGNRAQGYTNAKLPLYEAFNTLVDYYGGFDKPTDRNVPREYYDGRQPRVCNNQTVYIRATFKDARSGQGTILVRKDVPLWLAVDKKVQQGQNVELISKEEYMDWYKDEAKKEIRLDKTFKERQRQKLVDEIIAEDK